MPARTLLPQSPLTLAGADCQGARSSVQDLLCGRLEQARSGTPRAVVTARWLGCPPLT